MNSRYYSFAPIERKNYMGENKDSNESNSRSTTTNSAKVEMEAHW